MYDRPVANRNTIAGSRFFMNIVYRCVNRQQTGRIRKYTCHKRLRDHNPSTRLPRTLSYARRF